MEISKKTQEKNSILALALSEAIEKTVYDRTVRKRLAEIGSKFFEVRNEPWLSEKKHSLKWALRHLNFTMEDWSDLL